MHLCREQLVVVGLGPPKEGRWPDLARKWQRLKTSTPLDNPLAADASSWSLMGMTVYLTVREVAEIAHCEHKSVRRAISAGRLRAFQPTNKLLIREDDAYAWIEGRPTTTTGLAPNLRPAARRRRSALGSQRPGSVDDLREIERKAVQA